MDSIFKKDWPNNLSHKDSLAQPLKLKESLKIRDGLVGPDVNTVRWPQLKIVRLTIPDLGYFWVSNN